MTACTGGTAIVFLDSSAPGCCAARNAAASRRRVQLSVATTCVRKLRWGGARPAERYNLFVTHSSGAVTIKRRNIHTLLKDAPL